MPTLCLSLPNKPHAGREIKGIPDRSDENPTAQGQLDIQISNMPRSKLEANRVEFNCVAWSKCRRRKEHAIRPMLFLEAA